MDQKRWGSMERAERKHYDVQVTWKELRELLGFPPNAEYLNIGVDHNPKAPDPTGEATTVVVMAFVPEKPSGLVAI